MFKRTIYSEEHEMFRDQVRRFVEAEITPHHAAWEKEGRVSREAWLKAGENGLLCAAMPEEYGGAGADFLFSMVVMEELAKAGAMGPGFSLHSDIVAPYILHYGSEELKQEWLPKMARGEAIGAIAMTEPAAGSDVQGIKTTAIRDGDEYVINGQKVFITNGGNCDILILACKTDPSQGAKGTSLILVPADTPGFRKGKLLDKVGWK
ncbi:MAG: acyl-CoA dehydrogenase family protein, partial [Pseudooceanicola nanhaiensis]